jgi:hypothetical protein
MFEVILHRPPRPTSPRNQPSPPQLTPHAGGGQRCKKIRGKIYYFGPFGDPDAALEKYLEQKAPPARRPQAAGGRRGPYREGGPQPVPPREVRELRRWGDYPRSRRDCKDACDLIGSHLGEGRLVDDLGARDFAQLRQEAKRWGPGRLGNVMNRMRVCFKFSTDNGLSDRPVQYGQGFR